MKKQTLFVFLIFISIAVNAQNKNAARFFASYEDFRADKPVEGPTVIKFTSKNAEVKTNGITEKVKISKLPHAWFVNADGMLMRIYEGDLYYMLVDGPVSFYIKASEGSAGYAKDGFFIANKYTDQWPMEYYSETATGEVKKLKQKHLDVYLEKYGLEKQYDKDPEFKREMKDCVLCWQAKKTNKMIKYIQIVNEKMK